jgi:hypothetical protein
LPGAGETDEGLPFVDPPFVLLSGAQDLLLGGAPYGEANHRPAVQAAQDDEARIADYVQAVAGQDVHGIVARGHTIG